MFNLRIGFNSYEINAVDYVQLIPLLNFLASIKLEIMMRLWSGKYEAYKYFFGNVGLF